MTALHARILKAFRNEAPRRSARNRGLTPAWVAASVMMLLGAATASARSAEDYYHAAAHQYVAGKIQEASVEAEEGLRLYPGDAKLRMLAAHLRDMKDQQRGDQGQGDGQDKNRNPDRDREDNKGESGQGKQDQDQDQNSGSRDEEGRNDDTDRRPDGDARDEADGNDNERQTNAPQPRAMSEEEAERLLNSFADDEKKEQAERRKVIRSRAGTEQDW
ncbi:MAG TPA: hypothetical protein VKZ88_03265 [Fibrobacteria bacterium]|nr:hypothetical protein [Fibrobacteria bacterium]